MNGNSGSQQPLKQSIVIAILTGGICSALVSAFFAWWTADDVATIQSEIKNQFEQQNQIFLSERRWKEESLSKLLGPIYLQFDRTYRACARYRARNIFLEAKVLRVGNETIRDLLLGNAHLTPRALLEDAGKLVEHYDRWIEEFERLRPPIDPALSAPFSWPGPIWVGPQGFAFPRDAERRFREAFHTLSAELYGEKTPGSVPPMPNACYER